MTRNSGNLNFIAFQLFIYHFIFNHICSRGKKREREEKSEYKNFHCCYWVTEIGLISSFSFCVYAWELINVEFSISRVYFRLVVVCFVDVMCYMMWEGREKYDEAQNLGHRTRTDIMRNVCTSFFNISHHNLTTHNKTHT